MQTGAFAFPIKPFDDGQLLSLVRHALSGFRTRSGDEP
jgi:hypothetical protein